MRNTLLMIILILNTGTLTAQDFGSLGSQWYFNKTSESENPNSRFQHFESVKDTLYHGKLCHQINQIHHQYWHSAVLQQKEYLYQSGDTVFIYSQIKKRFLRFHVFNQTQGDSFELDFLDTFPWKTDTTFKVYVDSVKNISIKGVSLKQYHVSIEVGSPFYRYHTTLIDRIGWTAWFYPDVIAHTPDNGTLRCYSDTDLDSNFQNNPCDFLSPNTSLNLIDKQAVLIYPNPVQSTLQITISGTFTFTIYNALGQIVLHGISDENLDVSSLEKGNYFLQITTSTNQYQSPFIKQ